MKKLAIGFGVGVVTGATLAATYITMLTSAMTGVCSFLSIIDKAIIQKHKNIDTSMYFE